jgi:hypothetical protein
MAAAAGWDTSHWVPDEAVNECASSECGRAFGRLVRKHHCRRCALPPRAAFTRVVARR